MSPEPTTMDLARMFDRAMKQVVSDWEEMIGIEISVQRAAVSRMDSAAELVDHLKGRLAVAETRVLGDAEGPLYFFFPVGFVMRTIGTMVMMPDAEVLDRIENGMQAVDIEAFQELANLLCGSSNKIFGTANGDVRVSQSVDHLKVHTMPGNSDTTRALLPEGPLTATLQSLVLDGRNYSVLQAIPSLTADSIIDCLRASNDAA